MELVNGFRKLFRSENKRWVFLVGVVAITHLLFQSFWLPYGNALRSLLPGNEEPIGSNENFILRVQSSGNSAMVHKPLTIDASHMNTRDIVLNVLLKDSNSSKSSVGGDVGNGSRVMEDHQEMDNGFASEGTNKIDVDTNIDDDYASENAEDLNEIALLDDKVIQDQDFFSVEHVVEPIQVVSAVKLLDNDATQTPKEFGNVNTTSQTPTLASPMASSLILESTDEAVYRFTIDQVVKHGQEVSTGKLLENKTSQMPKELGHVNTTSQSPTLASPVASLMAHKTYLRNSISNAGSSFRSMPLQSDHMASENNSATISKLGKKKMRCEMPPKSVTTIDEMNRILVRNRRSSRAMRPRRSSVRDQEIVAARLQIGNAPVVNDQELYGPLFRNVSMFKRSYELMERILKVYVYKDGKKPIFHLPILKGLYASEGWFMKLMQGNKRYVVKDPRRAHLFYMPFSSRMLEYTLYVRNSHNRTNLRQFVKIYTETIATKYPYFNRTGGADHFLVACHDWAPYETRHHMEHCIKALCNADVTVGFKIGRDVSFPETYVRSARNPLRDLGGKPPSQRHILAFYAGNMHGYLRPILLKHWKDKDTDIKILGPMPPGVASKMNYIQDMKSSKYCICPKGYEVNSPRVVEAIFYQCVPVIISDNFVPPFFEVLDWGAFSIILAEKDIPNLRDVLLSIPKERYLALQLGVRKVQRHFLWHAKPEKYDLFHMTLHSIWYNRVYQIKLR